MMQSIIIVKGGIGMGAVMPVVNMAVQNEFLQRDLGVATSSVQLFRGHGSIFGTAIMGGVLGWGVASSVPLLSQYKYIQSAK